MTMASEIRPSLGDAIRTLDGKWGWFVAAGVIELIVAGIASTNLVLANLTSVEVIGAAMMVGGGAQIVHAVSARGAQRVLFWLLSSVIYIVAGVIVVYDPLLASYELVLLAGFFLGGAGLVRVLAAVQTRPAAGWRWIVAAGLVTFAVGVVLIVGSRGIALWLFGALLVVDFVMQGWSNLAFGLAIKVRAVRRSRRKAA
ncbi:MAG: HdeD family acid-resistance protein [Rhodopseudomonas palustris]|uniref:HdeD family acid-resistance protein n=1 Tax=Rhodopseudomonas palustris TaxID=1076 RepID=A0A933RW67_RHOPL|nr:HdeD family acid-resistance protein [Rhodopseudomonas palustris]